MFYCHLCDNTFGLQMFRQQIIFEMVIWATHLGPLGDKPQDLLRQQ